MKYLIKNGKIINEGKIEEKDILIEGDLITKIEKDISDKNAVVVNAAGRYSSREL